MSSKANPTKSMVTDASLRQRVTNAFACMNRSRDSAAEAAAIAYLISQDCKAGNALQVLENQIKAYNAEIESDNNLVADRFAEGDAYKKNELSKDHEVFQPPKDDADRERIANMKAQMLTDAALETKDRAKYFSVKAESKKNSSDFTQLVKYIFQFKHPDQAAMVKRYCLVLEWIAKKFEGKPETEVDVPTIKAAIAEVHGFARCVAIQQAEANEGVDKKKKEAMDDFTRTKAQEKLKAQAPIGRLPIKMVTTNDNFGLLLVRLDGADVEVIGEAGLGESDIARAVKVVGSDLNPDLDPSIEFIGRALKFASIIQDSTKFEINGEKRAGSRIITMRPDDEGKPRLIFSMNLVDASGVMYAQPMNDEIMGLRDSVAIMDMKYRDKLDKELRKKSDRCALMISSNTTPIRADGDPALAPLSWDIENVVTKEIKKIYWRKLPGGGRKPIDVMGFQEQFSGKLSRSDIEAINALIAKKNIKVTKAKKAEGATTENTKAAKTPPVRFTITKAQLSINFGDADTLVLPFTNTTDERVHLQLRHSDAAGLMKNWAEAGTHEVEFSGDDRGLARFGWSDPFGAYVFHQPTCGMDGKLLSRLVAPMRNLPTAQPLPGTAPVDAVIAAQQVAASSSVSPAE